MKKATIFIVGILGVLLGGGSSIQAGRRRMPAAPTSGSGLEVVSESDIGKPCTTKIWALHADWDAYWNTIQDIPGYGKGCGNPHAWGRDFPERAVGKECLVVEDYDKNRGQYARKGIVKQLSSGHFICSGSGLEVSESDIGKPCTTKIWALRETPEAYWNTIQDIHGYAKGCGNPRAWGRDFPERGAVGKECLVVEDYDKNRGQYARKGTVKQSSSGLFTCVEGAPARRPAAPTSGSGLGVVSESDIGKPCTTKIWALDGTPRAYWNTIQDIHGYANGCGNPYAWGRDFPVRAVGKECLVVEDYDKHRGRYVRKGTVKRSSSGFFICVAGAPAGSYADADIPSGQFILEIEGVDPQRGTQEQLKSYLLKSGAMMPILVRQEGELRRVTPEYMRSSGATITARARDNRRVVLVVKDLYGGTRVVHSFGDESKIVPIGRQTPLKLGRVTEAICLERLPKEPGQTQPALALRNCSTVVTFEASDVPQKKITAPEGSGIRRLAAEYPNDDKMFVRFEKAPGSFEEITASSQGLLHFMEQNNLFGPVNAKITATGDTGRATKEFFRSVGGTVYSKSHAGNVSYIVQDADEKYHFVLWNPADLPTKEWISLGQAIKMACVLRGTDINKSGQRYSYISFLKCVDKTIQEVGE